VTRHVRVGIASFVLLPRHVPGIYARRQGDQSSSQDRGTQSRRDPQSRVRLLAWARLQRPAHGTRDPVSPQWVRDGTTRGSARSRGCSGRKTVTMLLNPHASSGQKATAFSTDFVDGSNGTRTRDLRRDRPVLEYPGRAGFGVMTFMNRSFRMSSCGDYGRGPELLVGQSASSVCCHGLPFRSVRAIQTKSRASA
jgi:hypothetical protein